jgi:CrcB protein
MEALLLSAGGATGAVCRYIVGQALGKTSFPWATLVVNALGSLLLGWIVFGVDNTTLQVLVGTGFCGAFTTFSSFSFQTVECWERGERIRAAANAVGNLVVSLACFGGAWLLVG